MNIEKLVREEERIQAVIQREYVGRQNAWPIPDGVVNLQQYIESSPRILWILKEPYCDGKTCTGGGWSLTFDRCTSTATLKFTIFGAKSTI